MNNVLEFCTKNNNENTARHNKYTGKCNDNTLVKYLFGLVWCKPV